MFVLEDRVKCCFDCSVRFINVLLLYLYEGNLHFFMFKLLFLSMIFCLNNLTPYKGL